MKYIKKFEAITDNYKVGDYVLISGKYLQSKTDQPVKIVRELEWKEFVYMYDDGREGVPAQRKEIIRYLTPDEINDFETELNLKKFNI
jgi:hypothetical protein